MIGEKILIANYFPPELLIANFPIIGNYLTKVLQSENIDSSSVLALWLYLMKHAVNLKI